MDGGINYLQAMKWTNDNVVGLGGFSFKPRTIELNSNQDNLNILEDGEDIPKSLVIVTVTDVNVELSGVLAPEYEGEVVDGQVLRIFCAIDSTHNLVIKHESASSDAANRFVTVLEADKTLSPGRPSSFVYWNGRWREG